MRTSFLVAGVLATIVAVVFVWQASAQVRPTPTAPPASAPVTTAMPAPIVEERADRLLKQMGDYIASAQQFTFHADIAFDHVLPTGQKLQFSAMENVALQRPNELYIEWSGDLGDRKFWYDGKTATIYDSDTPFYGADAAPAVIDDMLDKLIKQLNAAGRFSVQ